jgi:hypothetical protein
MQQLTNLKHDPKLNLGFGNDYAPKIKTKAKSIPIDFADRVESANPASSHRYEPGLASTVTTRAR